MGVGPSSLRGVVHTQAGAGGGWAGQQRGRWPGGGPAPGTLGVQCRGVSLCHCSGIRLSVRHCPITVLSCFCHCFVTIQPITSSSFAFAAAQAVPSVMTAMHPGSLWLLRCEPTTTTQHQSLQLVSCYRCLSNTYKYLNIHAGLLP